MSLFLILSTDSSSCLAGGTTDFLAPCLAGCTANPAPHLAGCTADLAHRLAGGTADLAPHSMADHTLVLVKVLLYGNVLLQPFSVVLLCHIHHMTNQMLQVGTDTRCVTGFYDIQDYRLWLAGLTVSGVIYV